MLINPCMAVALDLDYERSAFISKCIKGYIECLSLGSRCDEQANDLQ